MSEQYSNEPMLDIYIYETTQNIEQLEKIILDTEKSSGYTNTAINEIFRIMHTIKGSSAMMLFNNISMLAHSMEDLFYFLREQKPKDIDCSALSDLVFEGIDFIKIELEKITTGKKTDGDASSLIEKIKEFLNLLKSHNSIHVEMEKPSSNIPQRFYIPPDKANSKLNLYKATVYFEDGCQMENIRAFTVIHNLKEIAPEVYYLPQDIIENDESTLSIRNDGFKIYLKTDKPYEDVKVFFEDTMFLKHLDFEQLENDEEFLQFMDWSSSAVEENTIKIPKLNSQQEINSNKADDSLHSINQSIISVNVIKLDKLMDLIGEMVTSEAMVVQNPDLHGLQLDNFQKAARQLHKITNELRDTVMSIRMVPLAITFQKMNRIVRDMSRKLSKEINLKLIGEETEVDKNIIEHISDPLMHLVRNSIDHGIEAAEDRIAFGKEKAGTITLEAKNAGSDVLIIIKDDGKGLNKEKILKKAKDNKLLTKPENEMTDREIYNLIFLPGFSTKDAVSEFSGRGVGMDVVVKNIETVGGSVSIDSVEGAGTTVTLKIPLTLAIIDGMNIQVGSSRYTIPTTAIKESFRPKKADLIKDPDGNEMIMVRGECYSILRLHQLYKVRTDTTEFTDGVLIMVEHDDKAYCIFADELLGQQQIVVKSLPDYIKKQYKVRGLAGCTLLGDGSISLILDIGGLEV